MTDRTFLPLVVLALSCAGVTRPLQAQAPPAMNAEQGWSAVGQCASITGERARHACLDDVLRRAGLLTPQAEATEKRRQFGLEGGAPAAATPTPKATVAAPKPAEPAPSAPAVPPRADAPERLEARIASTVIAPDGKVVLTTQEGAVWKQLDSDTIPQLPKSGEAVRIRKASLGSYLCELPSHHTFRCVRLK